MTNGCIWAKLEVTPTWLGAIATKLYKPPILWLKVRAPRGEAAFRLIPGMARAGFLLSPAVTDFSEFSALAATGWQRQLASNEVARITVTVGNESRTTICYEPEMRLSLFRLDFPREIPATEPRVTAEHPR